MGQAPKPIVLPASRTRVLGLPLAGVLSLGALWRSRLIWRDRSETASPIQGMARADDGGVNWCLDPDISTQWTGAWVPPHWGANPHYGVWAPYGGPAVPAYWNSGPSGGALDYALRIGEARQAVGVTRSCSKRE
jgi:hypothetical protein